MSKTKGLAVLLIIGLVISLSACGKVSEKVAEKGVEKLIESKTGSKVDITKDGAKIEANGQSAQVGDNLTWPKEAMGELPQPKAKVAFVFNAGDKKGCSVTVAEFENDDAKKYVAQLKEMGYKELMTMQDKDAIMFIGEKDKFAVNFIYSIGSKEGSITFAPKGE